MSKPLAATLLLTCLLAGGGAQALPPEFEARYRVQHGSLTVGELTMRLRRRGGTLDFETVTRAKGLLALFAGKASVRETSRMRITDQGLRADSYSMVSTVRRKERDLRGRFLTGTGSVEIVEGNERYRVPVPPGTVDRLGVQLYLMDSLARGQRQGELTIIDLDEAKPLRFEVLGEVEVKSGLGKRRAVHLRRVEPGSRWINEAWLDPQLGYLPLQLRQSKGGENPTRLTLRSVTWPQGPPTGAPSASGPAVERP